MLFNGKADLWFEMVWRSFCDKADDGSGLLDKTTKGSAVVSPFWEDGNLPLRMLKKLDNRDTEDLQRCS